MSIARNVFYAARDCGDLEAGLMALFLYLSPKKQQKKLGGRAADKMRWTFSDGSALVVPWEENESFWIEDKSGAHRTGISPIADFRRR